MNLAARIPRFPAQSRRPLTEETPVLLSVENLAIADAHGRDMVSAVNFQIPRGGSLGIVGESGSGKSLTCRAILGLLPPGLHVREGTIRFRGRDLVGLPPRGWRDLHGVALSAVFQDPGSYLNPSIPVGAQLGEALRATLRLDRRAARERALALFARVGLADPQAVYRKFPFELSGGMAQRVLIAIAVSANPELLIADEATTALDALVQAEVLRLLDELRREQGLTLVIVSHDLAVVANVCDHIIVMRNGAIVEAGPAARVLAAPQHEYTRSLIASHHRYRIEPGGDSTAGGGQATFGRAVDAAEPALLRIENLHASYQRRRHPAASILHGVDLELRRGEILGLIGETGSGKTTILRSILGVVTPSAGSIRFEGRDIGSLASAALRALRRSSRIQYVFQDPLRSLDPDLPVGASIGEGLEIRGGVDGVQRTDRVAAALRSVGLDPALAGRLPRELSGGQRQRVVMARALILDPAILLLDEPVSALDAVSRSQMLDLMRRLADEHGIAQIFISHDLDSIAGVADRVAVLHQGRIVEAGPADRITTSPAHAYTRRLLESAPRLHAPASRPTRQSNDFPAEYLS